LQDLKTDPRALLIYSEGAVYFKFFEDIAAEVREQSDLVVYYATSDPDDPCFAMRDKRFRVYYVSSLLFLLTLLCRAKALLMTMPDLGQLNIKRSIQGSHHFYLFHGMGSSHMVLRKGALDHYDSIFCVGPHQVREIRKTEQLYDLPAKNLIHAGYPLLDRMYSAHQSRGTSNGAHDKRQKTCLIAPSWAPDNIIGPCLETIALSLAESGFAVIIRPHPEQLKRQPETVQTLLASLQAVDNVTFELKPVSNDSLHTADVLITDWSSIAFEFAFGTERPVLFVDTPMKVNNPEYEKLELVPLEIGLREQIGEVLGLEELDRVVEVVTKLTMNPEEQRQSISRAREDHVFNFGRAAPAIAGHLVAFCNGSSSPAADGEG